VTCQNLVQSVGLCATSSKWIGDLVLCDATRVEVKSRQHYQLKITLEPTTLEREIERKKRNKCWPTCRFMHLSNAYLP